MLESAQRIGAIHPRVKFDEIEYVTTSKVDSLLAKDSRCSVRAVRWPVLEGVEAEGLLLEPSAAPKAYVVVVPDADTRPEVLAGLDVSEPEAVTAEFQAARILAESGCLVLVPMLIDRNDEFSANERIGKKTNQPHREFIYRMAYELGSHIIGYEVEKVLAAVDWFANLAGGSDPQIGLVGDGEGGLIAFYAAALDPRIDVVSVSGYFQSRQELWKEPIYRNVWGLLEEFGDAEIAGLIAPRKLIIGASLAPEIEGPPAPKSGHSGAAPGKITTAYPESLLPEFERAKSIYAKLGIADHIALIRDESVIMEPGYPTITEAFLAQVAPGSKLQGAEKNELQKNGSMDPRQRMQRQFGQLVEFTQKQLRLSDSERARLWDKMMPEKNIKAEDWAAAAQPMRDYFWEEVIGKFPFPTMDPNPRMRKAYDQPHFIGYETLLDVWPGAPASGVLLVPKDLKPGEKRPVVVCQHGLEGKPKDTIDTGSAYYHDFSAKLANQGFIVYAPQNPYIGGDDFRSLQRKANPLKKSLFSVIVGQHQQTINWLEKLPFVDSKKIAFYGLSYGGKTAMRVPAIEQRYCLSICSGDFNEWITKNATVDSPYSYMFTPEYEMFEFNLGRTFNYSDMAKLIAPRPFMVERGHRDGVAPDEWVAAEYAKAKRFYDEMGIGGLTEIEYFNGPHEINGEGTFNFLIGFLEFGNKTLTFSN